MKYVERLLAVFFIISLVGAAGDFVPNFAFYISITLLQFIYLIFGFALFKGIRFRQVFADKTYLSYSKKELIMNVGLGGLYFLGIYYVKNKFLRYWDLRITPLILIIVGIILLVYFLTRSKDNTYSSVNKLRALFIILLLILTILVPADSVIFYRFGY